MDNNELMSEADHLVEVKDFVGAEKLYSELIARDPANPHYHALRGFCKYRRNAYVEAERDFSIAIQVKEDVPNTLFLRARCREEVGDLGGALGDFRRVCELDPSAADAFSHIGLILEYQGDVSGARTAYESALRADANDEIAKGGLEKIRRREG